MKSVVNCVEFSAAAVRAVGTDAFTLSHSKSAFITIEAAQTLSPMTHRSCLFVSSALTPARQAVRTTAGDVFPFIPKPTLCAERAVVFIDTIALESEHRCIRIGAGNHHSFFVEELSPFANSFESVVESVSVCLLLWLTVLR
jgi:hypothetical protein